MAFGDGGFGGGDRGLDGGADLGAGGFSGGDRGLGGLGGGDQGPGSVDRGVLDVGGFSNNPPVRNIESMDELLKRTDDFLNRFTSERFGQNIAGVVGGVALGSVFGTPGFVAGRALGQRGMSALGGLGTPGLQGSDPGLAQNPEPGILPQPFAISTNQQQPVQSDLERLFPSLFGNRQPRTFR